MTLIFDFDKIRIACNHFNECFKILEKEMKKENPKTSKRKIFVLAKAIYERSELSHTYPLPDTWEYENYQAREINLKK